MNTQLRTLILAIGLCLSALLLTRMSLHADEAEVAKYPSADSGFTMTGTFVVRTVGESSEVIALIDPVFKQNAGCQFLIGRVSERTGYIQGTPFSGGMTFIPLPMIVSIQELKQSKP